MIRDRCYLSWQPKFDLFGGNTDTKNTINIYNYYLNAASSHSSNLYLNVLQLFFQILFIFQVSYISIMFIDYTF